MHASIPSTSRSAVDEERDRAEYRHRSAQDGSLKEVPDRMPAWILPLPVQKPSAIPLNAKVIATFAALSPIVLAFV
jgi:hypothetical protein